MDITEKVVSWGEQTAVMNLYDATQQSLIAERDDVSNTLRYAEQIKAFKNNRPATLRVKVPA